MTSSIWSASEAFINFPALEKSAEAEICVVGGGISGLTTAYMLSEGGHDVILVTDKRIAEGESAHTTGQIVTGHDDTWQIAENIHGVESTKLCFKAYEKAFSTIRSIIENEKIDCDYEESPAFLFATDSKLPSTWVHDEFLAAKRAGVTGIHTVDHGPNDIFCGATALQYERQAQFHPLKYLNALARILADSKNVQLYCHSRAVKVSDEKTGVTISLQNDATIKAKRAVLATNVPMNHRIYPNLSLATYRTYVIGMTIPAGMLPRAQYWDNEEPYHYVRFLPKSLNPDSQTEIILVGGEDHRVGHEPRNGDPFDALEEWAKDNLPGVGERVSQWSGETIETADSMPLLGRSAADENVFIITGDIGTGITHGTLGALVVRDYFEGKKFAWHGVFDPRRSQLKSLSRFVKENADSASQYRDWVTPGEVNSVDEIAPGSGAILRRGLSKVAVYNDPRGEITELSAVCTHLGAVVRWNEIEKSWDCPAHGSRFDAQGKVLNGPTCVDLPCAATCLRGQEEPIPASDTDAVGAG